MRPVWGAAMPALLLLSLSVHEASAWPWSSAPAPPPPAPLAPGVEPYKFAHERLCQGYEASVRSCPDIPSCGGGCVPQDCVFDDWSDWSPRGLCSGVQERTRTVKTFANACGRACNGTLGETSVFLSVSCRSPGPVNCVFGPWEEWKHCEVEGGQQGPLQRKRFRKPATEAANGGDECKGVTEEMSVCAPAVAQDCSFSDWADWTECSATCGVGRKTRPRHFDGDARYGGKGCKGALYQVDICENAPCGGDQSCTVSAWSEWKGCNDTFTSAEVRSRSVVLPRSGEGQSCGLDLKEVQDCPKNTSGSEDCVLSAWSSWSQCSKTCGGGQSYRSRHLMAGPKGNGKCEDVITKETESCSPDACETGGKDCLLSDWSDWGLCSASCGTGQMTRTKTVLKEALTGGKECAGSMNETAECKLSECEPDPCIWEDWSEWSNCTELCDGGQRSRSRKVLQHPSHGEACTEGPVVVLEPCNTNSCSECLDDVWSSWTSYTQCSASCGQGYVSRTRSLTRGTPCGKRATGPAAEFELCHEAPCVFSDCEFSSWGDWSSCSSDCDGITHRSRYIAKYAAAGGDCCEGSIKEVSGCNWNLPECTGDVETPECELEDWGPWSACSASCGGGQMSRMRDIVNRPCKATGDVVPLNESVPCATQPCEGCQDCRWAAWGSWSQCVGCEVGQRHRFRHIEAYANYCGQPCDEQTAMEVSTCNAGCGADKYYCKWGEWSSSTSCSVTCGDGVQTRTRQLALSPEAPIEDVYFFATEDKDANCSGKEEDLAKCTGYAACNGCVPEDCELSDWSDWSDPSCSGLCYRQREIIQQSNECGSPCNGTLVDSQVCNSTAGNCTVQQDCRFGPWGIWSLCLDHLAQRTRYRGVQEEPMNGGMPCDGVLVETEGCAANPFQADCQFSDWTVWSTCSKDCEGGIQKRERFIRSNAAGGGEGCTGRMEEVQTCHTESCNPETDKYDCSFTEWLSWSECSQGQRSRSRMARTVAGTGEIECEGPTKETEPCKMPEQNCIMSDWVEWGACDRTCGAGQQQRHRQVEQLPSEECLHSKNATGCDCPPSIIELRACELEPCARTEKDCNVSDWSAWSHCSVTCGTGQRQRTRKVTQLAECDGVGCTDPLIETGACPDLPACSDNDIDCVWSEWEDWSQCSCSCNGGTYRRIRNILTYPRGDGKKCDAQPRYEIGSCNTQPCDSHCVDGAWTDWLEWAPCTASCEGGLQWRHRTVARSANYCGKWPEGPTSEYAPCNQNVSCTDDVDCKLSQWSDWDHCSKTCYGVERRKRHVLEGPQGEGSRCKGAVEQLQPCLPGPGDAAPSGCTDYTDRDCIYSAWGAWQACTATCGIGNKLRQRTVLQPSATGKPCREHLADIKECASPVPCVGEAGVDCVWDDWSDWSDCTKWSGQTFRQRSILTMNEGIGKVCDPGSTVETRACRERGPADAVFCAWSGWEDWSICTASCGEGTQERKRHLQISESPVELERAVLRNEVAATLHSHASGIAVAFAAGVASMVFALAAFRRATMPPAGKATFQRIPMQDLERSYAENSEDEPFLE